MGILDPLRPKWKNSDPDVRIAAAKELDDPAVLVKMIIGDGEWFVRHNAFGRLRELNPEQSWYAKVMRESGDEEVRRKVVKVMTDLNDLRWVAKNDQYRYVRDAAEHRIGELENNVWGEGQAEEESAPAGG